MSDEAKLNDVPARTLDAMHTNLINVVLPILGKHERDLHGPESGLVQQMRNIQKLI